MAGRHRHAHHIREGAGIALGDGLDERVDVWGEHHLGRDHPVERAQVAGDAARRRAPHDDPAHKAPGESHAHPHPGPGGVRHRRGDGVVEDAIQVRQWGVDAHLRDREMLGKGHRRRRPLAGPP